MTERIKLTEEMFSHIGKSWEFPGKALCINTDNPKELKQQILSDQGSAHDWCLLDTFLEKKCVTVNDILDLTKENKQLKEKTGIVLAESHIANEQLTTANLELRRISDILKRINDFLKDYPETNKIKELLATKEGL